MTPSAWRLRGAHVVDPATGVDEIRDVGVRNGCFVPLDELGPARTLDLDGLVLAPGFIDVHVHLRDPGQTHKEDLRTGTLAAAAGGFATIVAMPNTAPPMDTPERVQAFTQRAKTEALVRTWTSAALTVERAGRILTDAAALRRAGAVALTDDGTCIQETGLALRALRAARDAGLPYMEHCEDESCSAGGVMNEGPVAHRLDLPGQSPVSEDAVVARDLVLAEHLDWPVHFQHLSTRGAVAWLRQARARNLPVSAEATPHHLFFTEEACEACGPNAKMNPPLRTETDRRAVLEAVVDGTIDVIATDHAPHTAAEKEGGMRQAPFGIIGLEAAVPMTLTHLVHTGRMTLSDLIARFTLGPARVLRTPQLGSITPGNPADLTLLDIEAEHTLDLTRWHSKARNAPYHGQRCRGKVVGTMVAGRWAYDPFARSQS